MLILQGVEVTRVTGRGLPHGPGRRAAGSPITVPDSRRREARLAGPGPLTFRRMDTKHGPTQVLDGRRLEARDMEGDADERMRLGLLYVVPGGVEEGRGRGRPAEVPQDGGGPAPRRHVGDGLRQEDVGLGVAADPAGPERP